MQTSDPTRKVPTRRMDFEESLEGLPKHFAVDGDLILSHLAACLSAVFPDGEDFFVRSVRRYRDRITDTDLKRQVAGFIGQEAVHGREHRVLNDKLQALGYPTKRIEGLVKRSLEFRERHVPAIGNLAVTAALEHFTATLGELVLSNPEVQELFGDERMLNIFLWHALEETEHKSVAFDVYKAVGGSERVRVWTMRVLRFGFIGGMAATVALSCLGDRDTYRRRVVRQSLRRVRRSPLLSRDLWERLKDYDRPDFHPEDHDTVELLNTWREKLFGEQGSLNSILVNAAA